MTELTDKIMPKGCHAEITDIFMDSHLLYNSFVVNLVYRLRRLLWTMTNL